MGQTMGGPLGVQCCQTCCTDEQGTDRSSLGVPPHLLGATSSPEQRTQLSKEDAGRRHRVKVEQVPALSSTSPALPDGRTEPAPRERPKQQPKQQAKEPPCCVFGPLGARLDEEEMLSDAWWLTYCCCLGLGCSGIPRPPHCSSTCCLCSLTCEGRRCCNSWELCACVQNFCGLSGMCMFPPQNGQPRCILCSEPWCVVGGLDGHLKESVRVWKTFDWIVGDMSIPCYFCCCGLGADPEGCRCCPSSRTLYPCCESRCGSMAPECGNEPLLCGQAVNCLWCVGHFRLMPPSVAYQPICACIGKRYKKPARGQVKMVPNTRYGVEIAGHDF